MTVSPDVALTAGSLAERLIATTVGHVETLATSTASGLRLPAIDAGHPVLDDARSDLIYVLGLLHECGVDSVAGVDIREHIPRLIAELDPSKVEAFFSYRVGETVLRLGGLEAMPSKIRQHVLDAVDTPETIARLESGDAIPPNYAIVAARVLLAQAALEDRDTGDRLERFVGRARDMFAQRDNGWIDDGMGAWVHFDIYTPDMYLFAQPLRDRIGDVWATGFANVLDDLDDIAQPGGAVVWGRSIGALGLAITVELAAAASAHNLGDPHNRHRWLGRAVAALDELDGWFPNGVIAAHQGRRTMAYRGPARRLQMTLDVYGKFLLAALEFGQRPEVTGDANVSLRSDRDRLIVFDKDRNAALWTARSRGIELALPMMMGFSTDYAPSPRSPGLFEHPTSGHPCMLPVISGGEAPLIPSGLPVAIDHSPGGLTVNHSGWGPNGSDVATANGERTATYRLEGRTLVVHESLSFEDAVVGSISISIPELADRPLDVEVDGGRNRLSRVDTSGMTQWRSFWSEIAAVHQIEIDPASTVDLTWRVTPRLRVASTITGHAYDDALYRPLQDRLVTSKADRPNSQGRVDVDDIDVLHMAWPEWWSGVDPYRTRQVLDQVRAAGVRIVWTQHNLEPHRAKNDDARACYQMWAEASDAVIHHSPSGMDVALRRYHYGASTTHHVIRHGHWGDRYLAAQETTREAVEAEEGWAPCALRLAVIGAPRVEKQLQSVVDAVVASARDDIQLVIRRDGDTVVPVDERIMAEMGHVEERRYHRRMAAYDAVVMPFTPTGMLTTGTAFDCIGAGVAAITSEWDFFDDTFAGGDIRYGTTTQELTACMNALTPERLAASANAMTALRRTHDWSVIAADTAAVLEEVVLR